MVLTGQLGSINFPADLPSRALAALVTLPFPTSSVDRVRGPSPHRAPGLPHSPTTRFRLGFLRSDLSQDIPSRNRQTPEALTLFIRRRSKSGGQSSKRLTY